MTQSCRLCLYDSSHPFGLTFKDGICSGCITHREKDNLNWQERWQVLTEQVKVNSTDKAKYDCVVPIVGDAEDFFVVSKVLELGLRPLIVSVNDYFKNDIGWKNLHTLITHFDVDSVIYNPNYLVYQELVKTSFRKFNHILLPFLLLHTSFPVHVACNKRIPLIIWGQYQPIEQVGKFSHVDCVQMSKWSRAEHDNFNTDIFKLVGNGAQVREADLEFYHYPSVEKLTKLNVTGIYLSNYLRWDPLQQNNLSLQYGFTPQQQHVTFDPYERAGSSVYYGIHNVSKIMRHGYSKLDDHLVREIRHGRLSKSEALQMKREVNLQVHVEPFFEWLGASSSGYRWLIKHHYKDFKFLLKDDKITDNVPSFSSIKNSELIVPGVQPEKEFILFGKGI